jgi:hypothetical protein
VGIHDSFQGKKKGYPQTDGSRIKGKMQPLQIISSFMLILTIFCPRLQEEKMVCQPRERERGRNGCYTTDKRKIRQRVKYDQTLLSLHLINCGRINID